jgi:hypothetical protein
MSQRAGSAGLGIGDGEASSPGREQNAFVINGETLAQLLNRLTRIPEDGSRHPSRRARSCANTDTTNPTIVTPKSSTPTTQSAVPENVNSRIVLISFFRGLDG